MSDDEGRMLEDGRRRICPICFEPVAYTGSGTDKRRGPYDEFECQGPAADQADHKVKPGSKATKKFRVYEKDYAEALARRGRKARIPGNPMLSKSNPYRRLKRARDRAEQRRERA